jgi:hypothetical protein
VSQLPTYTALRYVQPLREGGSLPAVVDTDGGGLFVVKFRGAGQGARVLVAELVVGLLAREAGLPVPDLALVEVPPPFGRTEPDPEIQDLLKASHGTNLGMRYLDGAFNFDAFAAGDLIEHDFAASVVWLDAFVTNPDRTAKNPNLLVWERRPWLIDHGAALYAHYDWASVDEARTRTAFPLIRQHVLLRQAENLRAADERMSAVMTEERIAGVLEAIPESLLLDPVRPGEFATAAEARERYVRYLTTRLAEPRAWVGEAESAREAVLREPPKPLKSRR